MEPLSGCQSQICTISPTVGKLCEESDVTGHDPPERPLRYVRLWRRPPTRCSLAASGRESNMRMAPVPVSQGYLNNVPGTLDCLDEDGWFRTGDVGPVDDKGNFFITDLIKELIKYKGFQVPLVELEGVLVNHPQIINTAVVGVMSEKHATELPCAYVVLAPGVKKTCSKEETLIQWHDTWVAPHKKHRGGIKFLKEIPKSASGKILRRFVRVERT